MRLVVNETEKLSSLGCDTMPGSRERTTKYALTIFGSHESRVARVERWNLRRQVIRMEGSE